jgi:hypothetical protein
MTLLHLVDTISVRVFGRGKYRTLGDELDTSNSEKRAFSSRSKKVAAPNYSFYSIRNATGSAVRRILRKLTSSYSMILSTSLPLCAGGLSFLSIRLQNGVQVLAASWVLGGSHGNISSKL